MKEVIEMGNPTAAAPAAAPKGDAGTGNGTEKVRQTPAAGQVVSEIPSSSRQGFWATEFEWFKSNPLTVKKYEAISPTTASYLRSEYGLDAHSRNTRDKRCDLYVQYDPDKADAIKNRPKRPRKAKAEGATKAPAKA